MFYHYTPQRDCASKYSCIYNGILCQNKLRCEHSPEKTVNFENTIHSEYM